MCFVTGLNIKTNKLIPRDMWIVGYHFPILNVILVVSKSFSKRKREEKLIGKIITDQDKLNVSYPGVIYPFYKVLTIFQEQCGFKLILVNNIKALVSFVHYITTIIMIWEFHGQLNLFWMLGPYLWRQCPQNLMHKRAHFTVSRLVI